MPIRKDLAGHPTGIFVLFLAEMWERFSYYGMRALLIFYLTQHFLLSDSHATALYGAYTALVYGASIAGGLLCDRVFGQWRSIVLGACLVLSGHVGLAIEGALPVTGDSVPPLFFLSLGFIVAGTGLFKPSSTALVGALYGGDTSRRRQTGYYILLRRHQSRCRVGGARGRLPGPDLRLVVRIRRRCNRHEPGARDAAFRSAPRSAPCGEQNPCSTARERA